MLVSTLKQSCHLPLSAKAMHKNVKKLEHKTCLSVLKSLSIKNLKNKLNDIKTIDCELFISENQVEETEKFPVHCDFLAWVANNEKTKIRTNTQNHEMQKNTNRNSYICCTSSFSFLVRNNGESFVLLHWKCTHKVGKSTTANGTKHSSQ